MANYQDDKRGGIAAIRGILPEGTRLRRQVVVVWLYDQAWLIDDLHERNIMRNSENEPTIIDALVGSVTPLALRKLGWLRNACEDARCSRLGVSLPNRDVYLGVNDDEL